MSDDTNPGQAATRSSRRGGIRSLVLLIVSCGALFWMARVIWENRDLDHYVARSSVQALRSRDAAERLAGARDLGRLGSSAREVAVPALIAALKDSDANVRATAAESL